MATITPQKYRESLKKLSPKAYLGGKRIENIRESGRDQMNLIQAGNFKLVKNWGEANIRPQTLTVSPILAVVVECI